MISPLILRFSFSALNNVNKFIKAENSIMGDCNNKYFNVFFSDY